MQLIYRSISYQSNAKDLASVKPKPEVMYRGISYQLSKVKNRKISGIFVLKYRGSEFIKVLNH